ncbi:Uncharacterized protein Fot_42033 [Forsythia ovata]|uniref:Uncharacterized protein n=1 Tax=Forsythia ovata TaxID=205694 RepID=A0ABD1RKS5_9LAMI
MQNPSDLQEILTYFRGSELQNYFFCILEDNLKHVLFRKHQIAKKNLSSGTEALSKTVQSKLSLKLNGLSPVKEVVIRESSPHSAKATILEMVEKENGVCEEPHLKPSGYRPSVGEKRSSDDDPSEKRSRSFSSSSHPLSKLFTSRRERLHDSQLTPLPSFMAREDDSVFCFFNQAWESWLKSLTTRHWAVATKKLERELESAKKNSEVEKLRVNVHRLMTGINASKVSTAENEEKLWGQLDEKKEELNMLLA